MVAPNHSFAEDMVEVSHARPLSSGPVTAVLLAVMAAIGQFAASVYTPSFSAIAASLEVDLSSVQLTLAIFFLAFGVGQLIFGPLADRFGRRPVLFSGLGLFLVGTLACAISPDLVTLLCARIVQALGGASTVVIARAAIRDSFDGVELVRLTANIMAMFALVPGVAPLIGAAALEVGGWRANFWLTLGVGAIILASTYLKLPETGKTRLTHLSFGAIKGGFWAIASDRPAMYCILAASIALGSVTAFIGGSPMLYMGQLGVSPAEYALYPFLTSVAIAIGAVFVRRVASKMLSSEVVVRGLALMLSGLVLMVVGPAVGLLNKHLFTATLIVYSAGFGVFLPITNAMVMARFSHSVGFVSSVLGFVLLIGAAFGAAAVSVVQTVHPILGLPLTMLILAVAAAAVTPLYLTKMDDGRVSTE